MSVSRPVWLEIVEISINIALYHNISYYICLVCGLGTDGSIRHMLTVCHILCDFCYNKMKMWKNVRSTKYAKRVKQSIPSKMLKMDSQQTETTKICNPTGLSKLQTLMSGWMSGIQHNISLTKHVPRELTKEAESSPTKTKKQLKKQEQKQREKARQEKTMQQTDDSVETPRTFRKDLCEESKLECINCRGGKKRLTRCRGCR